MKASIERDLSALKAELNRKKASRAAVQDIDIKQHIAPVYYPLHDDIQAKGHLFFNLPGGRGSCKSSFVSLEIVDGVMRDDSGASNAIIFRKTGATMRESVFAQVAWAISELGVSHLWRGSVSPMQFVYQPTGAQIVFRGLDDASKLKSIKPKHGVFRYVWFEEFSELPGANFQRNVLQSVVRGGEDFAVFRSFNPPQSANNWANRLINEPDERAITLPTNYTQVPVEWLGSHFIQEAERLQQINETAYLHEYMGVPTGTGGEVFNNIEAREITDKEISLLEYVYQGLDFGYVDPYAFIRAAYVREADSVYLLDEIYAQLWINAKMANEIKRRGYDLTGQQYTSEFLDGGKKYQQRAVIWCDCADPQSIADLKTFGIKSVPCHKEPGCVMYRTRWLQHRKLIIDPKRTPNAYREFINYSYETDKDGNFIESLPDRDNHAIDATCYALNNLIYYKKISA